MPDESSRPPIWGFRVIGLLAAALGLSYVVWRYGWSLNPEALWFAIPLVIAETYSLIDSILFITMMWKPTRRTSPPPLEEGSVDVFITTYNEPVDLVRMTADAARRIEWPDIRIFVLDDGAREDMRRCAAELEVGYITRGEEWKGKPRHAKAGNVNNALMQTSGEFILILDADQIPAPAIVRRCLGYFRDPAVAFVQTPQHFYNVPPGDPFGSDAPLFYGPILRGKDGWNAAFFCGSNAILRREALMQLGLVSYVREVERRFSRGLRALPRMLARRGGSGVNRRTLRDLGRALSGARRAVRAGEPLERVAESVRSALSATLQDRAEEDMRALAQTLSELARSGDEAAAEAGRFILRSASGLSRLLASSPEALGLEARAAGLDLIRPEEAIPVLPLATISVTEDMATAMRLHAMGWRSVYHDEVLAYGLAPEDLGTALRQRLRWAQGTVQVLAREHPVLVRGLSLGQRLQYFTTMYSYFSGFASLIYLVSPLVYLLTGIAPVRAWSPEFFVRLLPFLLVNRLMFRYATWGIKTRRGEQFSLALFAVWIRAVVSVLFGARPSFAVTPKIRQSGTHLRLVWPQILIIAATAAAAIYAVVTCALRGCAFPLGVVVNIFWGAYNVVALAAVVRAAFTEPPEGRHAEPPSFLFPEARGKEEP